MPDPTHNWSPISHQTASFQRRGGSSCSGSCAAASAAGVRGCNVAVEAPDVNGVQQVLNLLRPHHCRLRSFRRSCCGRRCRSWSSRCTRPARQGTRRRSGSPWRSSSLTACGWWRGCTAGRRSCTPSRRWRRCWRGCRRGARRRSAPCCNRGGAKPSRSRRWAFWAFHLAHPSFDALIRMALNLRGRKRVFTYWTYRHGEKLGKTQRGKIRCGDGECCANKAPKILSAQCKAQNAGFMEYSRRKK